MKLFLLLKNGLANHIFLRCLIFFLFLAAPCRTLLAQAIITFEHSGGRLGDNLISYLHGKWLSYLTGIPLQCNYTNFKYANNLALFEKELNYHRVIHPDKIIYINSCDFQLNPQESVCYSVGYFPESDWEFAAGPYSRLFTVDWKDSEFRNIALDMIAPVVPLTLTIPPDDVVSVAIHVREGGNFDEAHVPYIFPLKLPPLHFYSDALIEIAKLFDSQPIYCQIFTDAINPKKIVETIKNQMPSNFMIEFNYRKENNHDAINVLDDFFSLFHYHVLIRPESNFSKIPEFLHDYIAVVSPKHAKIFFEGSDKMIQIDEMHINIDANLYELFTEKAKLEK